GEIRLPEGCGTVGHVTNDSRVTELLEHYRFARESLEILSGHGVHRLERDPLAGLTIARAIDRSHPARRRDPLDLEAVGQDGPRFHPAKDSPGAQEKSPRACTFPSARRCGVTRP